MDKVDRHIASLDFRMLRDAIAGISDDWMSSKNHHPGWILIPEERFLKLRSADTIMKLRERQPKEAGHG